MPGTIAGGRKASETNKKLYGDNFYKETGRLGGIKCVPKGFAMMTPDKRIEAGRKGGTISRRKKSE
jgi:general stress protein YciG